MPESLDLVIGRALPGTIPPRDRHWKNRSLEMIDLLGQLATLAAIVADLASPGCRSSRRNCEHERRYEADENAGPETRTREAKLHRECIGLGDTDL